MMDVFERLLAANAAWPLLLIVKATLLLACAALVVALLPRRAAAARHLVWTLVLGALLVLPAASWLSPSWRLALPVTPPAVAVHDVAPAPSPAVVPGDDAASSFAALPDAARPASARVAWPRLLWLVWAAGVALMLGWLVVGRVALAVVRRRAEPLVDETWQAPLRDAAWLLELERAVPLHRSHAATMPVTFGVARPAIVLPPDADAWSEERRRAVLLHELSHVRRRDCLTQLVAGLACALWWFHPLAWYAARRMRVEREHACDDLVLSLGTTPADYAAQLLDLARRFRAGLPARAVALPMARPSHLEGRLLRVLAGPTGRRPPGARRVAAAAALAVASTLVIAAAQPALVAASPDAPRAAQDDSAPAGPAVGGAMNAAAPQSPNDVAAEQSPNDAAAERAAKDAAAQHAAHDTPHAANEDASRSQHAAGDVAQPSSPGMEAAAPPVTLVSDTPPRQRERQTGGIVINSNEPDSIARVIRRIRPGDAAHAITTRDGHVSLLLRDSTLVLQLTERGLDDIARGDERDEDRGLLSALLGSMLRGGLRVLLDHGIEYSLRDLGEARYTSGRITLTNTRGGQVFDNVRYRDVDIMESFDAREARAFVARVNAAAARVRR